MQEVSVTLNSQPTAAVMVTMTGNNPDVVITPGTYTVAPADWSTGATFMVRALWDIDTTPDIDNLTVTAIGGDYNFTHTVPVTITEDSSNEAVITTRAITVPERGTKTYQVVLNSSPTGDVVVTPASSDTNLSFDPPSHTFTTADWSTQQSFTVTAMDDGIRADGMSTITHTSTGYSGAHHDEVSVTITNTSSPA